MCLREQRLADAILEEERGTWGEEEQAWHQEVHLPLSLFSLSHTHTLTRTHHSSPLDPSSLTHSLTHTHTHAHSLAHTRTHTLSLSLIHILSLLAPFWRRSAALGARRSKRGTRRLSASLSPLLSRSRSLSPFLSLAISRTRSLSR